MAEIGGALWRQGIGVDMAYMYCSRTLSVPYHPRNCYLKKDHQDTGGLRGHRVEDSEDDTITEVGYLCRAAGHLKTTTAIQGSANRGRWAVFYFVSLTQGAMI